MSPGGAGWVSGSRPPTMIMSLKTMPGEVSAIDCCSEGSRKPLAQIDAAVLGEAADGLASLRIEAEEVIDNAGKEPAVFAIGPVRETARRLGKAEAAGAIGAEAGIEGPQELAGGGVKGDDLEGWRKGVKRAPDDERIGLDAALFAGIEGPCHAQANDVGAVDLAQRRVMVAVLAAVVGGPGDGLGGGNGA